MSQPQVFNGVTYSIPVQGDLKWGPALTRYLAALGTYSISPAGGLYALTADLNLGTNFGVVAKYLTSESNNSASAGQLRLATNDLIGWRNTTNSADLYLAVNSSNQLTFNNVILNTLSLPVSVANGGTGVTSLTTYAVLLGGTTATGAVQDAGVGSSGQVLTSQGPGGKPIWSAAGTGSGTVNTGTANQLAYYATSTNAVSGLTAITASRALTSDTNGLPVASGVTATTLAFLDATSSVQTQLNAKQATLTPGQLPGTTTNNNATAGNVGEYVESIFSGTAFPATGVYGDATSISLTAGDWEVTLNFLFSPGSGLTSTNWSCGISQTSGNSTTGLVVGSNYAVGLVPDNVNGVNAFATIAAYRQSLSGTTTIYAKFSATYSLGGPAAFGRLSARRMR